MFGMKIKIYYRGIEKMCTKCYGCGHIKKDCNKEQVPWIKYVAEFINQYDDIPDELFGRWMKSATLWYKDNLNQSVESDVFKDAIQSPKSPKEKEKVSNPLPTKGEPAKRGRPAKNKP